MTSTFLIVGASLTGAKAAESLRTEGFDGQIVLLGAEPDRPYERPPLSKDYLQSKQERDSVFVHAESWYAEHQVDLRLGTVAVEINRKTHQVRTAAGDNIRYDKLLIATGCSPRRLPVPGGESAHYLRTLADSERLGGALRAGGRIVVVGAGWIGLEVAAAARTLGAHVTVVEHEPTPLHAILSPELGNVFARVHRDHGVDLRLGTGVTEIRADGVVISTGEVLPADAVVVGVGALPATELAENAGLAVDNGIVVDAMLCTSDPDIYAAGDVANALHPGIGKHIRVEHWANALNQGVAAGAAMFGKGTPYDRVPYFYTDQFTLGMEYSGFVAPGGFDQIVYRGSLNSDNFIAFWLKDSCVLAGMSVNVGKVTGSIQELIRAGWTGHSVAADRLADTTIPLNEVIAS